MNDVFKRGEMATTTPPIFEFDGKGSDVQEISLDNLAKSIRRESGLSGIRSIPAQYWKLYALILGMLTEQDLNFDEKPIWVQNNASKAYLTDEEKAAGYTQKNAPVNRWRFDKIISTIQLPGIVEGDNEGIAHARNAAIGLTLNKEGLSIAFGMNVWACTNFNVMGGTIMRSYGQRGQDGIPWDVMQFRIQKWLENISQIWRVQNDIMHNMKATVLPHNENIINEIIGNLYIGALKHAYFKGEPVPFNTYELSDFVQESIRKQKEQERVANVWDVYNWGTSIMKPGQVDIGEIAENSNMWANYLMDYFALPRPDIQILEVEE